MPLLPALLCIVFLLTLAGGAAGAADADPRADDRKELIKMFREIEASINAQDVDRMVQQMAPDATVTWLNGEVSRGHAEIKAYYDRMVKGEKRILDRYTTSAKVAAPARFFGNGEVAVADGTTEDEFFPVARGPFRLSSKWTSTSAKLDGQWKVVGLHLSSNVFTNPLLDEAKTAVWYAATGCLAGGFMLGWFMARMRRRAISGGPFEKRRARGRPAPPPSAAPADTNDVQKDRR